MNYKKRDISVNFSVWLGKTLSGPRAAARTDLGAEHCLITDTLSVL